MRVVFPDCGPVLNNDDGSQKPIPIIFVEVDPMCFEFEVPYRNEPILFRRTTEDTPPIEVVYRKALYRRSTPNDIKGVARFELVVNKSRPNGVKENR